MDGSPDVAAAIADYAARNATKSKGTASLKLDRDPLGSQFLNDLADAVERIAAGFHRRLSPQRQPLRPQDPLVFPLDPQRKPRIPRIVPIIAAEIYALLVAALAIALRAGFREAVALRRCTAIDVGRAAAACAAAYAVIGPIQALVAPHSWSAALAILKGMGSDDGRLASAGPVIAAVILVRACVLAPLGEELLFRGALHTWLRRRLSASATIAITAAAFALIHGFPPIFPAAFALGIAFGVVRERTSSTVPTIVVHAVHNVSMVAMSGALTGWTARLPQWGAP